MRKLGTIVAATSLLAAPLPSAGHDGVQLRVSAVIPPKPCRYPDTCKRIPIDARTSVIVHGKTIYYVASPPRVEAKDGVLQLLF